MFSRKDLTKALNIGLAAIGILILLYVQPLYPFISEETFYTISAFLGFPTLAALRELFISQALKTRLFAVLGIVVTAIYAYGYFYNLEWFDLEKFKFILYLVLGLQGVSTLHGAIKSNFKTLQE